MRTVRGGDIAVLRDPEASSLQALRPAAVVDAIMAKRTTGTSRAMAPFVVGLGPGFNAVRDVDAVVETNRGPDLGRVIWAGEAEANTGEPGPVAGRTASRVLRAPASGRLLALRSIGDIVREGEPVAEVDGQIVRAGFLGLVRGLARDGLTVERGMKIGDIDPRLEPSLTHRVSDKALAVAGGVLEALMMRLKELDP
jgi:xanthine dehydrogenase accessory factor